MQAASQQAASQHASIAARQHLRNNEKIPAVFLQGKTDYFICKHATHKGVAMLCKIVFSYPKCVQTLYISRFEF